MISVDSLSIEESSRINTREISGLKRDERYLNKYKVEHTHTERERERERETKKEEWKGEHEENGE